MLTPSERTLRARLAANTRWASEDRGHASERQRRVMLERFENAVDPDGSLRPAERAARAQNAMAAHMQSLAFKSVKARRQTPMAAAECDRRPAPMSASDESNSREPTAINAIGSERTP